MANDLNMHRVYGGESHEFEIHLANAGAKKHHLCFNTVMVHQDRIRSYASVTLCRSQ